MSDRRVSRREFLGLGIVLLAGVAVPSMARQQVLGSAPSDEARRSIERYVARLSSFTDPHSLRQLGVRAQAALPLTPTEVATTCSEIFGPAEDLDARADDELRQAFDTWSRVDLEATDTVVVDGWQLGRHEATVALAFAVA